MEIPDERSTSIPIGKADIKRQGNNITLISHSRMVSLCLHAAEELFSKGISAEVVDLRTIKPLDLETISASVRKTHFCVIVEEGHAFTGIASEIAFQIQERCFGDLDAPVGRVCQKEAPTPYSNVLESESLPSVPRIMTEVQRTMAL